MSPWHDLELEAEQDEDNSVTGVIIESAGSQKVVSLDKASRYNPIM